MGAYGGKSDKNRSLLVHFEAHFLYLAEIGKYVPYTGGPLLTQFFETLEKQPCRQKTV